jgi:hypothetical protein
MNTLPVHAFSAANDYILPLSTRQQSIVNVRQHRFDDPDGFRRLDPGRPSGGREFSDGVTFF